MRIGVLHPQLTRSEEAARTRWLPRKHSVQSQMTDSTGQSGRPSAPFRFVCASGYLRPHLVLVLIAISFCALILFPLTDCFDCEEPQPWGRNDAAYATRSVVFDYWLSEHRCWRVFHAVALAGRFRSQSR
jgi:hypothetical protein